MEAVLPAPDAGYCPCMDAFAAEQPVVHAVDDLALIATAGFFVPAAIIVSIVAFAVWRDRRRSPDDAEADVEG